MSETFDPNPYQGPQEASSRDASYLEPAVGTPKTFGILNIIFASLLMLCGMCYGVYVGMFAAASLSAMSPKTPGIVPE